MGDVTIQPRGVRAKSIRFLRERAGMFYHWAKMGHISWSDYAKAMQGLRVEAEMFMAENILSEAGGDAETKSHPSGDPLGGEEQSPLPPRHYVRKKTVIREGVDGRGFPVNDKRVTEESGGPEDLVELDEAALEIARLM